MQYEHVGNKMALLKDKKILHKYCVCAVEETENVLVFMVQLR